MSSFEWIPNTKLSNQMHFPAFYWDNSYRRQPILEPVEPDFWSNNAETPIDGFGLVAENLTTRSVYSPLLLLPQSLVMFFFGRVLKSASPDCLDRYAHSRVIILYAFSLVGGSYSTLRKMDVGNPGFVTYGDLPGEHGQHGCNIQWDRFPIC